MDDLDMYHNDRPAWIAQAAPRTANRIARATEEEIKRYWSCMERDYQTAVWQYLDDTQRARIRKLRSAA